MLLLIATAPDPIPHSDGITTPWVDSAFHKKNMNNSIRVGYMRLSSFLLVLCGILASTLIFNNAASGAEAGSEGLQGNTVVAFNTSEFTQPNLDVSSDGRTLYFDVLGEIFSVSVQGGFAKKVELGAGWKERPMLSPDGTRLAFLSDRDGPYGVWVKPLNSPGDSVAYDVRPNADVISASWLSSNRMLTSGRGLEDAAGYSLMVASDSGLASISIENQRPGAWRAPASMTSSRDGRHVYYMRNGLKRLDQVTGVETAIEGLPDGASQLRLTPDERHIGFVPEIRYSPVGDVPMFSLLDLNTGKVKITRCAMEPNFGVDGDGALHATYDYLPSGRSIVLGRGGKIRLCELYGEDSVIPISASVRISVASRAHIAPQMIGPQLRYLAASPDGTKLAFTARGSTWLLGLNDHSVFRATQGPRPEYMPYFSPDSTQIVYVSLDVNGMSSLHKRTLATGVVEVLFSTNDVLANPTWSPDGKRIAFVQVADESGAEDGKNVELKWITLADGEQGTFTKNLYPFANSNRSYPTLAWNRASEGIFYSTYRESPSERYFMHQSIGQSAEVVYELDWSVWDVSISPSGRFIAFMDISGITVAPAPGSNVERLLFDRERISRLKRVANTRADYMSWLPDDRIAWSVQDEVFVTDTRFDVMNSVKVSVPSTETVPAVNRIAYVGANIVTMTGNSVVEHGVIVTKGRHIEYVGPPSSAAIQGAEIVDVAGKTIIPGMIDVHHHQKIDNLDFTPEISQRLFSSAAYGVTTVFDPSFKDIDGTELRESSNQDSYLGATFYTSGAALMGPIGNQSYARIDSYDDAVGFIKRKAQAGSIVVKGYLQPSRDQRRWLSSAARSAGLGITGHERNDLRTHMTMVVDGYSGMEHTLFGSGGHLYGDIQKFLISSGISMTPTLADGDQGMYFYMNHPPNKTYFQCLIQDSHFKRLSKTRAWIDEKAVRESGVFDMAKQYAQMLNEGGVVALGGHSLPGGIGTHWEMWLLEMAGASPMNALRAATVNGATKLGLESSIGSLVAGMDADFVVLNSNPLDDIKNSTDISRVVRRGRTVAWPSLENQPASWTMQASWDECKTWNLGLPPSASPSFDIPVQAVGQPH